MRKLVFLVALTAVSACGGGEERKPVTDAELIAMSKAHSEPPITVHGKTIRLGDTVDDVIATIGAKPVSVDTSGLFPKHIYEVDGQRFRLTFARDPDPGAYRLIQISTTPAATSTSTVDCVELYKKLERTHPDWNFIIIGHEVTQAKDRGECRDIEKD
jgi:hypothetical protein